MKLQKKSITAGRGRCRIEAEFRHLGRDVLLWIWGGAGPHIGSVVITEPGLRKTGQHRFATTSSVLSFPGHKDEAVARLCGEHISAHLGVRTVACAGIHIPQATTDDIALVMKNAGLLCRKILLHVRQHI